MANSVVCNINVDIRLHLGFIYKYVDFQLHTSITVYTMSIWSYTLSLYKNNDDK
jgi:hypothetical protein